MMRLMPRFSLRTTFTRSLVALLMTATAAPVAFADEWGHKAKAAQEALKEKDYTKAEEQALEALNMTEGLPDSDEKRLTTLRILSQIYRHQRQWAASANLLEQIIAAHRSIGMEQSQDMGNIWNELAIVYHNMRDFERAENCYEQSLAIKRRRYKQNVASIAIVESNLGELYRRKKDWDKAEKLLVQSISDKENELGPEHPTLIASFTNLALVRREQKRYPEAHELIKRAIALAPKHDDGIKNVDHAAALANLGDIYSAESKHKEAKDSFAQALAMRRELLGDKHPHVGETLRNLGNVELALGEFDNALAHYDEAQAIFTAEYGAKDSRSTRIYSDKALVYDRMKKPVEAAQMRELKKQAEGQKAQ